MLIGFDPITRQDRCVRGTMVLSIDFRRSYIRYKFFGDYRDFVGLVDLALQSLEELGEKKNKSLTLLHERYKVGWLLIGHLSQLVVDKKYLYESSILPVVGIHT